VLPVLQGALGALIIATAALLALSHLGVNVAPLIAGAGIFGLAIGFGSQALVRDIVAGIFYMFDDAFRLGEYIEAGKHKGTVERIALRSVRLRHQNGQIHTLPYGQLGAVTNYSRDYSTRGTTNAARLNRSDSWHPHGQGPHRPDGGEVCALADLRGHVPANEPRIRPGRRCHDALREVDRLIKPRRTRLSKRRRPRVHREPVLYFGSVWPDF
jgi:hypothetical protein